MYMFLLSLFGLFDVCDDMLHHVIFSLHPCPVYVCTLNLSSTSRYSNQVQNMYMYIVLFDSSHLFTSKALWVSRRRLPIFQHVEVSKHLHIMHCDRCISDFMLVLYWPTTLQHKVMQRPSGAVTRCHMCLIAVPTRGVVDVRLNITASTVGSNPITLNVMWRVRTIFWL